MYASDLKHPDTTLEQKLHRLYTLNRNKTIDLSFRPPFLNLLKAFGNPHLNLPPVIHVAGTNGKGSIIAMMRSILEVEGFTVHAYTSPHLERFNERLYVAGAPIDNTSLENLIDEALHLNDGGDLTFFEITTAIAFAAFSRTPADICLLEVGMGGRLDCTNVIKSPLVSIINTIAYDHTEYLGETLSEIAKEKAGIMKAQTPCVIGVQNGSHQAKETENVFKSKAQDVGAPLFRYGADWLIEPFESDQPTRIRFIFQGQEMIFPRPGLQGTHQIENAGSALAALKLIENWFPITQNSYAKGLKKAHWPARLQRLNYNLPDGWTLYLDGGHNENAAKALAISIAQWGDKDLHLVLGMMQHKNPKEFLKPLLPHITSLTLVDVPGEPMAHSAAKLENILKDTVNDLEIYKASNFEAAIQAITATHNHPANILIAGSLYLAGHVLHKLNKTS